MHLLKRGKIEKAFQILRCVNYGNLAIDKIGYTVLGQNVQYISESTNCKRYDILYFLFNSLNYSSKKDDKMVKMCMQKLYQALEFEYAINTSEVEFFLEENFRGDLSRSDREYEDYKDYYLFFLHRIRINNTEFGGDWSRIMINGIFDKCKPVQLRIYGIQTLSLCTVSYHPQLLKLVLDEQENQDVRIETLKYLLTIDNFIECSIENFCPLFVLNVASPINSLTMMLKDFLKNLDKSSREVLRTHLKMTNQSSDIISLFDVFVEENSQLKLL